MSDGGPIAEEAEDRADDLVKIAKMVAEEDAVLPTPTEYLLAVIAVELDRLATAVRPLR